MENYSLGAEENHNSKNYLQELEKVLKDISLLFSIRSKQALALQKGISEFYQQWFEIKGELESQLLKKRLRIISVLDIIL